MTWKNTSSSALFAFYKSDLMAVVPMEFTNSNNKWFLKSFKRSKTLRFKWCLGSSYEKKLCMSGYIQTVRQYVRGYLGAVYTFRNVLKCLWSLYSRRRSLGGKWYSDISALTKGRRLIVGETVEWVRRWIKHELAQLINGACLAEMMEPWEHR